MKIARIVFFVTLFVMFSACEIISGIMDETPAPAKLQTLLRIIDINSGKPLSEVSPGQPVKLVLELKNMGDETIVLKFNDGQQYDFEIRDTGDQLVWNSSYGHSFTQALTTATLAQKGWIKFTPEWDQKDNDGKQLPAGVYIVSGIIPTAGPIFPTSRTQTLIIRSQESIE